MAIAQWKNSSENFHTSAVRIHLAGVLYKSHLLMNPCVICTIISDMGGGGGGDVK